MYLSDVYKTLTNIKTVKDWTNEEHEKLMDAIKKFGLDYEKLEEVIGRSYYQLVKYTFKIHESLGKN